MDQCNWHSPESDPEQGDDVLVITWLRRFVLILPHSEAS